MTLKTMAAPAAALMLIACGGGGGKPATSMIEAATQEPVTVELRQENGPAAAEVLADLRNAASGGPWYSGTNREYEWRHPPGLGRYSGTPTVRVAEGTNDHQRAAILHAVAMINRALPYENHVRIGPDAEPGTWVRDVPDGEIFVTFAPHDDWLPPPLQWTLDAPLPPTPPGPSTQACRPGLRRGSAVSVHDLSPVTSSARDHSTSELLRTL